MGAIASQITSLPVVYSTVYSDADQRKHQSSASLAFVQGIHRVPVNSPHIWPVTRKMFPFDDVIMISTYENTYSALSMSCGLFSELRNWELKNFIRQHVQYNALLHNLHIMFYNTIPSSPPGSIFFLQVKRYRLTACLIHNFHIMVWGKIFVNQNSLYVALIII